MNRLNQQKTVNKCPVSELRHRSALSLVRQVINGVADGARPKRNFVWLEVNGCSGNIISLLDGMYPDMRYLISEMTNFYYNNTLNVSEGNEAMQKLFGLVGSDFILAVEGAVSTADNGMYNIIGRLDGRAITGLEAARTLGEAASYVLAVGACATHGGVSAARPNPTGCVGVQSVLQKRVIKLPGCPCHPDWFLGTLAHIILFGDPPLDSQDRPMMFYSTTIHDRCQRRSYFDAGIFASKLGEKTCMFNLGCRGPETLVDCPVRQWDGYVNWPVKDDSPCIGCANLGFPDASEPFISYNITRILPTGSREGSGGNA